jgi:hypothetical protein
MDARPPRDSAHDPSVPTPGAAHGEPHSESKPSTHVRGAAARFEAATKAACPPLRDRFRYWAYYLALAHFGKPAFSAERDAVYEDGLLARGYTRALERINRRLATSPALPETLDVPAFAKDELSPADFRHLRRKQIPFVIRGGAQGLPVMDWTLESLEALGGDCTGPINAALDVPSTDTSRPTKAHHYYDFHLGTLSEVADSIRSGGKLRLTVAEDVMHRDDGRLRRDLDFPHWESVTGWTENQHHWLRSRLFIGKIFSAQLLMQAENAFSLWHTEPGDSLFVLARGTKTWTLAHPVYSAAMRPRVKKTTNYTGSNIDLREPDTVLRQRGFAGYLRIPKARVTLHAGDMLRVPNFWWHTVETHPGGYTLAASLRVEPGPNLVAPALLLLRLFDKKAQAIMKAYARDGRITDDLIGVPRKSRSAT